jgi:hypothetical protein
MKTLLAPLAVVVALTLYSSAFAWVTPRERAVIRHDVRELRYDVRHAGPILNPAERAAIRNDARSLRYDVRRAVRW